MGTNLPPKRAQPQIFGSCLLRPNGWMDQAATWYGGRPRPRRHCVRWGPPRKGVQQPPLFGPCILRPNGRPSQQLLSSCLCEPPFPHIDIIGAVVIVWRVRGKTIRSVPCNIVCSNCAQCDAHTYEQTNSSLDWVLSHWAHFTVLRFIFVLCITVCCMHA